MTDTVDWLWLYENAPETFRAMQLITLWLLEGNDGTSNIINRTCFLRSGINAFKSSK